MQISANTHVVKALIIVALAALAAIVFQPGTSGSFQLDDYDNLKEMQRYGDIDNANSFKGFVFGGISGPTGRPVSLASFLVDTQSWPAEPYSFIRTNIIIHILNGIIIFFLIQKLSQLLGTTKRHALTVGTIATGLWLIHPLQTSTVLYVIQRMTELSSMFILLGTLCYLHGRMRLNSEAGPGYVWMSVGIVIFGLLATLSKENGILLPVYIAVIEFTLLRNVYKPAHWKHWSIPMLWLPIIVIFLYMANSALNHESSFAHRDFTFYERIINQPIILMDYIRRIFIPTTFPTLNYDDFVVAKSLWQPVPLFAAISVSAMIIGSLVFAKRQPVICFAILWFFGGHLLESSVLNLEMYFEHRNYLPLLGPLFAVAFYANRLLATDKKRPTLIALSLVTVIFSATTWSNNNVWGDHQALAKTWAENQPGSMRAQMTHTLEIFKTKGEKEATAAIVSFKEKFPDVLGIEILHTEVMCMKGQLTNNAARAFLTKLTTSPVDIHVQGNLAHLIDSSINNHCQQIGPKGMLAIIQALLSNPATKSDNVLYSNLQTLKYRIHIAINETVPALKALDEAFRVTPTIDIALKQARILTRMNQTSAANSQLNKAEALNRLRGRFVPSRLEEINDMREELKKRQG
ncbi:hypothetical protein ACFL2V_13190 [Pseudomonadota bacterium]